ncbi:MAG: outer membrane protein assembly factor BamE [Desulfarculus sp.]|nr:outer membrane protein assembly factor BamE [Desulfarculus sp.]
MAKRGEAGRMVLVGGLWLVVLALVGCSRAKNLDNFRQVRPGMTAEQVRRLLGEPDRMQEASGVAGVWEYHGRNWYGGQDSTLTVTLVGGRVMLATLASPASR